jgi:hypothetical protein
LPFGAALAFDDFALPALADSALLAVGVFTDPFLPAFVLALMILERLPSLMILERFILGTFFGDFNSDEERPNSSTKSSNISPSKFIDIDMENPDGAGVTGLKVGVGSGLAVRVPVGAVDVGAPVGAPVGTDVNGDTVGDPVGAAVGVDVEPPVGAPVGADVVGSFVGDPVGATVGTAVEGAPVGAPVGVDVVGSSVGDPVGVTVGAAVVRAPVGDPVGADVVGSSVGSSVGAKVGADVVGTAGHELLGGAEREV